MKHQTIMQTNRHIEKIISGGQTGVDRAALDVAIKLNILHSGWCPKDRIAEDGQIPQCYHLQETPSEEYAQRTEWNVRDADGTLILSKLPLTGGTLLTLKCAQKLNKPHLIFDLFKRQSSNVIINWLEKNNIKILNIAGPRASSAKNIYRLSYALLQQLLKIL